jgi:hypothetical protein
MSTRWVILASAFAAILLLTLGAGQALAAPLGVPASQTGTGVSVCTWLGCKTAAVSYSQDDAGNISGGNSCRPQLEAAGFRGTFYYDGNTTQSWMAAFSAAGHEIGSHLVNHNLNCTMPPSCFPNCTPQSLWQTPYTPADVTAFRQNQIEPNIAAIEAGTGRPVVSMALPCGSTDAARMTASQYYFVGVRGYYDSWDSNFPWIYDTNATTPAEFMNLNADTYFSQTLVDRAISQGTWEIATVHDYCEGIPYLSSKQSSLWVAPVGEVLKYVRVRNAAQFSNYSRAGQIISFDAVHNLGALQRQKVDGTMLAPIVYDNPVTLQVPILASDTVVNVQVNGLAIAYNVQTMAGSQYVLFDTPLNSTRHVVVTVSNGPVTATATPLPSTPTNTPVASTSTSVPPTNTPVPPTSTSVPPTNTPVPPTSTSVPLTNTPVPPTSTSVPPTSVPGACPCSLWGSSAVPAVPAVSDIDAVELGVQFRAAVNGSITGLRFYKGGTNTGTHVGNLWTSTGALLATATFANETASGWQTVTFANPVPITANTTYVASYQTTVGHFAADRLYFNSGYSNSPLYAFGTGEVVGGNGVYVYPSGFPNQSYQATNYWVDVIFDTMSPVATPTNTPVPPTNTPVPPTNTPVPPTNTPAPPTNTPTQTPTSTTLPDLIFANGFEAGNLSAWSASTTNGGALSASTSAALVGTYGLRAAINSNTAIYVTDDTPNAEPRYRARFYFDPNSIVMSSGDAHYLFYGYTGASTVVLRVELRRSLGTYQVRAALVNNSTSWTNSAWFSLSDALHFIELDWRAATAAGANNGGLTLWIDGTQLANLTGVANDTRRIDRVRLGPVAGIDSGTRGTEYFDAFESRRQTYVGP